ncbi:MAG: hypothetical protein CSA22_02000 [Deltaproteobacteria bacterium]|nr:MAG: hypothetical protein CSA22_02000 [Deltaproteobacteria bacterium]
MIEYVTCTKCGKLFKRNTDEPWKQLCLSCYHRQQRQTDRSSQDDAAYWRSRYYDEKRKIEQLTSSLHSLGAFDSRQSTDLGAFMKDNLKTILLLVHPDKHRGLPAATRITQDLLDFRKRGIL